MATYGMPIISQANNPYAGDAPTIDCAGCGEPTYTDEITTDDEGFCPECVDESQKDVFVDNREKRSPNERKA